MSVAVPPLYGADVNKTPIGWTDFSANPLRARNRETGKVGHFCEKVSPGCAHCYASEWNEHRYGTGVAFLPGNRELVEPYLDEKVLEKILLYRGSPAKLFLCDMTDLFAEWVKDEWLDRIFATMALQPRLTFQVLTKRPERMREYFAAGQYRDVKVTDAAKGMARAPIDFHFAKLGRLGGEARAKSEWLPWPLDNVWLGVSVENQHWADERIPILLATPAAVRFLSCEPLLGPLDLTRIKLPKPPPDAWLKPLGEFQEEIDALAREHMDSMGFVRRLKHGIDWVIAGGESAGPAERALVERCICGCHGHFGHYSCPCGSESEDASPAAWIPKPEALAWVRSLRDQCVAAGVPFFWKQWAGPRPTSGGRLLDGRTWDEAPA